MLVEVVEFEVAEDGEIAVVVSESEHAFPEGERGVLTGELLGDVDRFVVVVDADPGGRGGIGEA